MFPEARLFRARDQNDRRLENEDVDQKIRHPHSASLAANYNSFKPSSCVILTFSAFLTSIVWRSVRCRPRSLPPMSCPFLHNRYTPTTPMSDSLVPDLLRLGDPLDHLTGGGRIKRRRSGTMLKCPLLDKSAHRIGRIQIPRQPYGFTYLSLYRREAINTGLLSSP